MTEVGIVEMAGGHYAVRIPRRSDCARDAHLPESDALCAWASERGLEIVDVWVVSTVAPTTRLWQVIFQNYTHAAMFYMGLSEGVSL